MVSLSGAYFVQRHHEYRDYDESREKIEHVDYVQINRDSLDYFFANAPEPKNHIAWQESLDDYAQDFDMYLDSLWNYGVQKINFSRDSLGTSQIYSLELKSMLWMILEYTRETQVRVPNLYEDYTPKSFYDILREIIEKQHEILHPNENSPERTNSHRTRVC